MPEMISAPKRNWFGRQSIVTKIRVVICVFLSLSLVIALSGWLAMSTIQRTAQQYARFSDSARLVYGAGGDIGQAMLQIESTKKGDDASRSTAIRKLLSGADDKLAKARLGLGDEDSEVTLAFGRLDRDLADLSTKFAVADRQSIRVDAGANLSREAIQLGNDLAARAASGRNDSDTVIAWGQTAMFTLALIAAINGALAVGLTRRDITGPLKSITEAMLKLAEGDRELVVPGLHETNEIGDMARSLDVFRRGYLRLDRMRTEAAEAAKAEVERQNEIQREREASQAKQTKLLLELAEKFELTVGEVVSGVAAASSQLQLTATSMASAADQSAVQTSEVSTAMNEASAGVTAAAAASDEFAMSINEISRQAASSAELARKATVTAGDADATISALAKSAEQASEIVKLISTIAHRTNLLALNASIEAARGGEAGRGFAVVASEVKELADRTSKATEEVAQQIRDIQESTECSVTALRAIGKDVEELEATSVSIAAAVDQQSVAGQHLARSIDLAARSADDVTSNIAEVRETSLATGAAASQVLTSATELEQQAVILKIQVEQFLQHVRASDQVPGSTPAPRPMQDGVLELQHAM